MKINPHQDIKDFHAKFLVPVSDKPDFLNEEMLIFRERFMHEELREFSEAHAERDLAKCLDALVDLVYVAIGTAHIMGLPFDQAWEAVHTANMAKERATSSNQSKRGTQYDVIKPAGWTPPDIEKVISDYQYELNLNA
jgi:predicted HAD superfamily Cof-like phosphohydrolase